MNRSVILPQFALLADCADALKAVDVAQWKQFSPEQRRGAGLLGRWAVERALWSLIVFQGKEPPFNASLMELYALSRLKLTADFECMLARLDGRVITHIILDEFIEDDYRDLFLLAHSIQGAAQNIVTA